MVGGDEPQTFRLSATVAEAPMGRPCVRPSPKIGVVGLRMSPWISVISLDVIEPRFPLCAHPLTLKKIRGGPPEFGYLLT